MRGLRTYPAVPLGQHLGERFRRDDPIVQRTPIYFADEPEPGQPLLRYERPEEPELPPLVCINQAESGSQRSPPEIGSLDSF